MTWPDCLTRGSDNLRVRPGRALIKIRGGLTWYNPIKKQSWPVTQLVLEKNTKNLLTLLIYFKIMLFLYVFKKKKRIGWPGWTHLICILGVASGRPSNQVWKLCYRQLLKLATHVIALEASYMRKPRIPIINKSNIKWWNQEKKTITWKDLEKKKQLK